jgi:hypothetical protein
VIRHSSFSPNIWIGEQIKEAMGPATTAEFTVDYRDFNGKVYRTPHRLAYAPRVSHSSGAPEPLVRIDLVDATTELTPA